MNNFIEVFVLNFHLALVEGRIFWLEWWNCANLFKKQKTKKAKYFKFYGCDEWKGEFYVFVGRLTIMYAGMGWRRWNGQYSYWSSSCWTGNLTQKWRWNKNRWFESLPKFTKIALFVFKGTLSFSFSWIWWSSFRLFLIITLFLFIGIKHF